MARFLRIVIFALLIAAIVFFGFRASQPLEEMAGFTDQPEIETKSIQTDSIKTNRAESDNSETKNTTTTEIKGPSEAMTPPDSQDSATQEANKKEDNTDEADKAIDR